MGRKSKPIMHLIILLCGLFMHLISSHPYSCPGAALTHVDQLATVTQKERFSGGKSTYIYLYIYVYILRRGIWINIARLFMLW